MGSEVSEADGEGVAALTVGRSVAVRTGVRVAVGAGWPASTVPVAIHATDARNAQASTYPTNLGHGRAATPRWRSFTRCSSAPIGYRAGGPADDAAPLDCVATVGRPVALTEYDGSDMSMDFRACRGQQNRMSPNTWRVPSPEIGSWKWISSPSRA